MTAITLRPPAPRPRGLFLALLGLGLLAACETEPTANNQPRNDQPAISDLETESATGLTPTVFATNLRFPRGFTFGPDGQLYVAEAGNGGSAHTRPSQCEQVEPPVGPYTNGRTARISRIDAQGHRSTFASGFPSAQNALGDVSGVSDVAFVGDQLYALLQGGGCSHGRADVPAGIARVSSSGDWTIVADLSAYQHANPVADPPADFEPDGSWYSMLSLDDKLFAVDANHGEVVRVLPGSGRIHRVADVSAKLGHVVPTALAQLNGVLYFGNLGTFPITPRTEKVWKLQRNGTITLKEGDFTTVLGLDFDSRGRMYVLETSHVRGFPTPGTGRVVRVNQEGGRRLIVDNLFFPTAMRFGPDGRLYISNKGFGPPQPGEILRVDVP